MIKRRSIRKFSKYVLLVMGSMVFNEIVALAGENQVTSNIPMTNLDAALATPFDRTGPSVIGHAAAPQQRFWRKASVVARVSL